MCGEVLQADLLAALHRLAPHAELLVVRTLDRPVAVDVLLDDGPRDGLLARPRAVLDVVAVEPHLVVPVEKLDCAAARHGLRLGGHMLQPAGYREQDVAVDFIHWNAKCPYLKCELLVKPFNSPVYAGQLKQSWQKSRQL